MRVLHTSDWHLGVHHTSVSRGPDHDLFLGWLETQLASQEVDVLIIAGDVFDSMQPSADALRRYYGFLCRVEATGVAHVVIVGGNHDSPSRLDAPAELLSAMSVHVIGGLSGLDDAHSRCLVPLSDRAGVVRAVALAVPYVHEFRLGVRTTDADAAAIRAAFRAHFSRLYTELVDLAQGRWPGLPIIATGHLTMGPATAEDYPHAIHQVGTIDSLPDSVLDPRIQYTALGHIHRSYPVGANRRAWYCGSPIALSQHETSTPRKVLLVDLNPDPAGMATVTPLLVPAPRGLVHLRGTPAELETLAAAQTWDEPLPPLLFCVAVADALPGDLMGRLHAALAGFADGARPVVVELRQELVTPLVVLDEDDIIAPLHELTPGEVFAHLCRARGQGDVQGVEQAFHAIAAASVEDFDAMLKDVRGGAA